HRLALDRRLEDRVYVVYVSPLRALNNDIEKNLRAPLAGIRAAAEAQGLELPEVRVAVRTGDTLAAQRQAMTRRPPHILITTPESLYILLTAAGFRPALSRARFVIVDEVHALLGGKRGAHLALSLERLQALVQDAGEPRPQRIGCSATVRPIDEALAFVTGATAHEPVVVDAGFSRDLDVAVVARARHRRRGDRSRGAAAVAAQRGGGASARGPRRPRALARVEGAPRRHQGRGAGGGRGGRAVDPRAHARSHDDA